MNRFMGGGFGRILVVALGACAVTSTASQAFAADAPAAEPQGATLGEVVVTATRRAVSEQKVGVSLTVLSSEQLAAQAPRRLDDLGSSAPNVLIGQGTAGPAQATIFIRGQGYSDVERDQAPPVGVIRDGVTFAFNTGQLVDMFDICTVEVDRGPQGIFYGKNTTAGLINITRCAPTREYGGSIQAGYGSFNDAFVRGLINAPLGDRGGFKLSAQYHSNDGYMDNVFTGGHAGSLEYSAVNAVVDYDLTDWLSANFSFDHAHDNGGGTPVQFGNLLTAKIFGMSKATNPKFNPATGSPDGLQPGEVENRAGDDDSVYDNDVYSLILKAKTGIGEVVSQTAFVDEKDLVRQDFDGTCRRATGCLTVGNPLLAATGGYLQTIRTYTTKQFTQEFRLSGSWNQFDYTAGVFYYRHKIGLHQNTNAAVNQFSSEEDESWGEYVNVDWNVTPTIKLSAGAREIDEEKDFKTRFQVNPAPGVTVPLTPQISQSRSWSRLITRLNAQWQATPDVLFYASRAEGFRSGGFSIRGTLAESVPGQSNYSPGANFLAFAPETNVTYEIGVKSQFFDRALTFNFDGFLNQITDMQQTQVTVTPGYGPGTNTFVINLPKVEIKGLEMSAVIKPSYWAPALEGLTLSMNAGIQTAEVKNGRVNGQTAVFFANATAGPPGSTVNFTGITLNRVPAGNYNLRADYSRDLGPGRITTSLGYSWIGRHKIAAFGTQSDFQPSFGMLDASINYDYKNYYIKLSGKNLTNEDHRTFSLPSVFIQGWAQPISGQVEVGVKF